MNIEKPLQIPFEIQTTIGKNDIDDLTKDILFLGTNQNKFKLCYFKTIKKSQIKTGKQIDKFSELESSLQSTLIEKFPHGLYEYQQRVLEKIIDGENVVISAPTGTGKTESFLIPIIQNILKNTKSQRPSTLLVYPTKALAKDQEKKIKVFTEKCNIRVNRVDGDTQDKNFRRYILNNSPDIFITNFDFIKYQLQQESSQWKQFFAKIQTLVIDEVHYYGGILGSNVYYLIQSLARLSKKLQIITASATLDNAQEFCEKLTGRKFECVEEKNKPGTTDLAIISELDSNEDDIFPKQLDIMLDLLEKFYHQGKKTIVFHDSHDKAEIFAWKALRERKIPIDVHRAGLLVQEREEIERRFRDNDISVVSCTPTLELGIDIGDVDVVISSTVSFSRFKQRLGRAGRNQQRSYAFLVLGQDPISQWYKNHPADYLAPKESILVDPFNQFVERNMMLLLASAKPIDKEEKIVKSFQHSIQYHLQQKNIFEQNEKYNLNYNKTKTLLNDYSIRAMGDNVIIEKKDSQKTIGTRATPIAFYKFYNGAIYMHNSKHYYVTNYVRNQKYPKAVVESLNYESYKVDPYYTRPILQIEPKIIREIKKTTVKHTRARFCELLMKIKIHGFYKISVKTNAPQDDPILYSSPMEFEFSTVGFVFKAPQVPADYEENEIFCNSCSKTLCKNGSNEDVNLQENECGYHAIEHLLINASLTVANNSSSDVSGYSTYDGMIYLYDNSVKGGNGATESIFRKLDKVFSRALQMAKECKCKEHQGCPLCTHLYHCERCNGSLSKHKAIDILESLNSENLESN